MSSLPSFRSEYGADVLREIPSDGLIRYFPDANRSESPLLVGFTLGDGSSWFGAFGAGTLAARACTGVFASPSSKRALVVSRGRAYLVDVDEPEKTTVVVPELVMQVVPAIDAQLLLIADPWRLHAFAENGLLWSSDRISVEGLTIVVADEQKVLVRVEDADGEIEECSINIRTGRAL